MNSDWNGIRNEYVTGDMSLRRLAAQHPEVKVNTLLTHSKTEGWKASRDEYRHRVNTQITQKMVDRQRDEEADRLTIFDELTRATMYKIQSLLSDDSECIGAKELKNITSALKDIADIIGYTAHKETDEYESGIVILPEIRIENIQGDYEAYNILG